MRRECLKSFIRFKSHRQDFFGMNSSRRINQQLILQRFPALDKSCVKLRSFDDYNYLSNHHLSLNLNLNFKKLLHNKFKKLTPPPSLGILSIN